MATTPLWVPLAVAALAVAGTLAGVISTQAWNSRLEERRWAREAERLREAQAREDVNRTYEHRRAAYVDFLQELERLQFLYIEPHQARLALAEPSREPIEPPALDDPVFYGLRERYSALTVYGTHEAQQAAYNCLNALIVAAVNPEASAAAEHHFAAQSVYLRQIRKDLGVPEQQPVGG
jgi:hypothetical protein